MGAGKREFGVIGWALVILWLVGNAVASKLLFRSGKSVRFKKRYFPVYVIAVSASFALLLFIYVLPGRDLLWLIPVMGIIAGLNILNTKFCERCGEENSGILFGMREKCRWCGGRL